MSLILSLKWSAKSSQRASVGVLEDLIKLRITFKVMVKTYTSININMPMDFLWSINIKKKNFFGQWPY